MGNFVCFKQRFVRTTTDKPFSPIPQRASALDEETLYYIRTFRTAMGEKTSFEYGERPKNVLDFFHKAFNTQNSRLVAEVSPTGLVLHLEYHFDSRTRLSAFNECLQDERYLRYEFGLIRDAELRDIDYRFAIYSPMPNSMGPGRDNWLEARRVLALGKPANVLLIGGPKHVPSS